MIGIAVKREKPIADQIYRRLVTGAEQQDDIGREFLVGELVAIFLRLNEMRGEIVAGLAAAQLKQPLEILGHGQIIGILLFDFGLAEWCQVEQTSASARASEEDVSALLRDAQHVADHGHRQPESKIRNEIHTAAGLYAIDNIIDDLLNARAHVLDAPRSKRADNKTAQPAMIGRIELQHPVAHTAIDRFLKNLGPGSPGHSADEIFAKAFVAQDFGDVGMAARDIES